jgi:2-polyprenyl-3-methyl-5-hydroxy-6-metoxy-1,4-benzoquinol methylase
MDDDRKYSKIRRFYNQEYYAGINDPQKLPRHYRSIARRLGAAARGNVLDVACGAGEWLALLRSFGARIHGIDISEKAIEICRKSLPDGEFHCGPAEQLPFESASFDLVTCLGSLEHFIEPENALREMMRVAKPDASFLLLVPNSRFLTRRLGLFGGTQQTRVREVVRSPQEWTALFESVGLVVQERWRDLHVLSADWVFRRGIWRAPLRFAQALALPFWPISWQYQIYHLCVRTQPT